MHIGRRAFVVGAGASALAGLLGRGAPWPLAAGRGQAQEAAPGAVRRLIIFFSPNGTVHRHWRPTGEGADYAFAAGSILEPLDALRQHLLVLDGIDFKGVSNHEPGMAAMLTGGGPETSTQGQSVDQLIASQLAADTPFPSLELGVGTDAWGGGVQTRMLYAPGGDFVHPDQDPANVYRRVFGGVVGSPQEMDARMRRKESVLSLLRAELGTLRDRVGSEEHAKLDVHLEALRRMEVGLTGPASNLSCDAPPQVMQLDPNAHESFADVTRAQTDLLVTALACGMTRVASLQLSHTVGPHVFSWLGLSEGHHGLSHMDDSNTDGVAQFVMAERWISEQFAYLLEQLQALPEPGADGSMLDHTLVVWAKELADGRLHDNVSVPFVLAGAPGYLRTGRYLRFDGEPHQKLLVSICHAMGLDNPTFGDPSHGTGPLSGLT
ncbi:MAG: DUF1552 domain-containing protein [Myxococcales bacterium]|nr:DUF1552 domain-containing protein [Myxococcales bacterium]